MTATPGSANLAVSSAFVDELARRGLHHVVIAPGSRSTPLAVAFATHPAFRLWMHVDERSAAFFGLGMARALGQPVAMVCTSGTAAADFLPAVVEAHYSRVPLIVLTADRPPELRAWGAAQTIDQFRLFGSHAKWFTDMPIPEDNPALLRHARSTAARAVAVAAETPQGPVHLNVPFREPLLPADPLSLAMFTPPATDAANGEAPSGLGPSLLVPDDPSVERLAARIRTHDRGIIVCGPGESTGLADAAMALGAIAGYPVLADPLSGVRFGDHHRAGVIDAYDAFLRDADTASRLAPDLVLRTGGWPTSKPLQTFLTAHPGQHHVLIDPGEPRDPAHLAATHLRADPTAALLAIEKLLQTQRPEGASQWLTAWTAANCAARQAMTQTLHANEAMFEGRVAADLVALLPDGATLVAGNSMPVRDVDTFAAGDRRHLRIIGNRGASGIDGVVSTALGAAAVLPGPVVLLIGDLSFFHDMNGLLAAKLHAIDCTIVVLNNDGGGIFSFLPQADLLDPPLFERLFGTPTGLDFRHSATLYGASFARPETWSAFRRELCRAMRQPGLSIVEVVTDRGQNVTMHRHVWEAVRLALSDLDR